MLDKNAGEKILNEKASDLISVNCIPYPVIILNENNSIEYLNDKAKNIFLGIDLKEKVENIVNSFHKEFIKKDKNDEEKIKASIVTQEGQKYFEIFLNKVYNNEGKITRKIIILNDFTEVKLQEENLHKKVAEVHKNQFIKSTFLLNMSHEIRTTINGIIGMTDLTLMSNINLEEKEHLNLVKINSLKLLDIINNILDFSNIQSGTMKLENLEFKFTEFINEIIKINTVKALEKKIEFKVNIDESISETLVGDCTRLKQILNNIIGNSIKFTESGTVCLNIGKIDLPDKKIKLQVNVQDTGIGIDKETLSNLFTNFNQLDDKDYTKKNKGTGLGLAICNGLIEMMQGNMEIKSKKNIGTSVNFNILLEKSKKSSYIGNIEKKDRISIDSKVNKVLNILIVEDDKASQMVLSNLFKKKGHSCDIANNGKEAVNKSQNRKYDLILMDIQMPIMDGLEATQIIRKHESNFGVHTPIIALTAYTLKEDREKFLNIGMDDYISKPFKVEELLEKVYSFGNDKKENSMICSNVNNTNDGLPLFLYLL